jgi:hypothetical protein
LTLKPSVCSIGLIRLIGSIGSFVKFSLLISFLFTLNGAEGPERPVVKAISHNRRSKGCSLITVYGTIVKHGAWHS